MSLGNEVTVSFDSERLILVDAADNEIGSKRKDACHDGDGILHRAFSAFIFNNNGELLLQQRASGKRLWPGYWSNSCCSHPRFGETMDVAVLRRLSQELGIQAQVEFLYKFQYQAKFGELGSENELCSVFVGRSDDTPKVNSSEIASWRFISPQDFSTELSEQPEQFTPWCKMEWQALNSEYNQSLAAFTQAAT
ncbi:MAG: isopentenyl-diphosphate Delta-isomerase [Pseudomonadota bacterium]